MALPDSLADAAERSQHGGGTDDAPKALLGVESGGEFWLVDLADAGEVLPVPVLSEVPLTRSWFCGIANIRGTLYCVTDLAAFHGAAPTPLRAQTRLLLTSPNMSQYGGGHIALLVSNTQGLKSLSALQPVPAPADADMLRQAWRGERYGDAEGRSWSRLLLPQLLNTAEFLDIAV